MSVNKSKQTKVKVVRTHINKSETALRHTRSEGHRRYAGFNTTVPKSKISGIRTLSDEKSAKTKQETVNDQQNRRIPKGVTNTSVWESIAGNDVKGNSSRPDDKDKKRSITSTSDSGRIKGTYKEGSGNKPNRHNNKESYVQTETNQVAKNTGEVAGTAVKEGAKEGVTEAAKGASTGGVSTIYDMAKRTLRKTREELEAPIIQADIDNGDAGNPDITKSSDNQRSQLAVSLMAVFAAMVQIMMPVILAILIPSIIIAMLVGILTSVFTPVVQMEEAQESVVTDASDLLESLDDEIARLILEEAFKYEGNPYKFGGTDPNSGIDCAAFTQWCYRTVGISLPRTAQGQYDAVQHISIEDARPGDLVFFTRTYDTDRFITHVELFVGDGKCYGAGDPIGYHDLASKYYSDHYVCCGRVGGEETE